MKILTAETNLTSATNISKSPVIRVYNSDSSAITLTRKSNAGETIGSYSVPSGKVIYCEKSYTDTLEGGAALKATGVGYSEELDIICLGNGGGGLPVTANLLFHFDAADSSSGDSTWTDKTSNNYVMTANGSPTYSSSDGGSWDFNGSSQYFENSSDIGTSSAPSAVTLIAFVKRDGSQSSWTGLVYGRQNSYINSGRAHGLHLYGSNPYIGFSWNNTWDNNSNLTIPDDEWCMVAVTMESGDSDFYLYKDSGTTTASNTATLNGSYLDQGTWIWRIARDANEDNRYWDGKIAIALAYTSKLTQTELTSIWDAYKSRYGY
jgi:hypothetical protein